MELSKKTKEYWDKEDWVDLNKSKDIKDLYKIAHKIIKRMPKPIVQVCGPISTGGRGSIEANLNEFNEMIKKLQSKNLNVFDQMPYEEPMHKMMLSFSKNEYMISILDDFYLPLFESGQINELHFLPEWQSSRGATWEHEQAKRLGIKIVYL